MSPLTLLILLATLSIFPARSTAFQINVSNTSTAFSASTAQPASITPAPSAITTNLSSGCPQCLIMGAVQGLSQVFWWTSVVGLTLDTVSVLVTQYSHTAITSTRTIYGNINTINVSTVLAPEVSSSIGSLVNAGAVYDITLPSLLLASGTDGSIDSTASIAYPTPYVALAAFNLFSVSSGVSPRGRDGSCLLPSSAYAGPSDTDLSSTLVQLPSTYYQTLINGKLGSEYGKFDNASFISYLKSAGMYNKFPALKACYVEDLVIGPPAFKIPVSAITGTISTTVAGVGNPNAATLTPAPQPGGYITPSSVTQTREIPFPSRGQKANVGEDQTGEILTIGYHNKAPAMAKPSPSPAVQPPAQAPSERTPAQGPLPTLNNQSPPPPSQSKTAAAPAIVYAGSTHRPDVSSVYSLPSIGNIVAGGSQVAPNNVIYSLAPSADTLVSNGHSIPLTTIAAVPAGTPVTPVALPFAGSTYTANSASAFNLAAQTLTPGGAVTVNGTPLSLPTAGTAVVIGGSSTQALITPTSATSLLGNVFSFAGSAYTVDAASEIVIGSETLSRGAAVTMGGTAVSFAAGGGNVVVGTSTEALSGGSLGGGVSSTGVVGFEGGTRGLGEGRAWWGVGLWVWGLGIWLTMG